MKPLTLLDHKIPLTLGALALTLALIIVEYLNGGVITHHLLADDNLPGVSNWWGLVTVPLATYVVVTLLQKRQNKTTSHNDSNGILYRFFGALTLGIAMCILWAFELVEIMQYLIVLPVVIALFRPVYLPECFLGFVYGMLHTFGGILPILIGLVLTILCFIAYKGIRAGILFLVSKI